jgi:hypothetical protein
MVFAVICKKKLLIDLIKSTSTRKLETTETLKGYGRANIGPIDYW